MPNKRKKAVPASVGIASPRYGVRTGLGAVTQQFGDALLARGISIGALSPMVNGGYGIAPARIDDPDAEVSLDAPYFWRDLKQPIGIVSTPQDGFDGSYILPFSDASKILCPSAWSHDAVRACTKRKTSVWRFGIDTETFVPVQRERGDVLRVLHFAADNSEYRKGADIALEAFLLAFEGRSDVEFVLRSTEQSTFDRRSTRARQEYGMLTPSALADYYRSFDVVVYSSRAEAFASVAIEAMACGIPVIHSGATGMEDITDLGLTVPSRPVPAVDGRGQWAEPDMPTIAQRLQEVDADYDAVTARAAEQAQIVHDRFNWDGAIEAFLRQL